MLDPRSASWERIDAAGLVFDVVELETPGAILEVRNLVVR
jgi:hypothetical protein